ncbi:MAG: alpha/beta fold hydrolase [Akkermansiaceae bacterium]|nr:alpha/beta fold hydrolase [Akkermansiaceae bacterium]
MKRLQETLRIDGQRLERYIFAPDDGSPVRAAAIHFHGHGDYAMRYEETLAPFPARGVVCVAADLPGHGLSDGHRGCVPGWPVIDELLRLNRERCRELCPDGPLGILGHSAGGLIALRAVLRDRNRYAFSWLSSPLLRPELTRHPLLVGILRTAARLFPGLSVSTGVTREMCRHPHIDPLTGEDDDPSDDALNHDRICLGWGNKLVIAGQWVRREFAARPPRTPILVTQGSEDAICPAPVIRELVAQAGAPSIRYEEFAGRLHEPFSDDGKEEVFAAVEEWLGAVLAETAQEPSPSG